MAEWYDKTEGFDAKEAQYLLLAYRNTLCKTDEGQQVLCHLKTMLENFGDNPTEKLVARKLFDVILNNCGITDNMKIVKALSGVAESFNIPETKAENLLETD